MTLPSKVSVRHIRGGSVEVAYDSDSATVEMVATDAARRLGLIVTPESIFGLAIEGEALPPYLPMKGRVDSAYDLYEIGRTP